MASANAPDDKICALCHRDCSAQPRTKDDAGRYYCRECIERVKRERHEHRPSAPHRAAVTASSTRTAAESLSDDTDVDVFADVVGETGRPPALQAAPNEPLAVRHSVRHNTASASKLTDAESQFNVRLAEFVKRPWVAFFSPMLILALLFNYACNNPHRATIYLLPQTVFSVAVTLIIYVEAFRKNVAKGLLTLCIPPYLFYHVLTVHVSPLTRALFAAALISGTAGCLLLPHLASTLQPVGGTLP